MNAWSKQPDPMTTEEHEKILKVIEQAEALEKAEQERVGQVKFAEAFNVILEIELKIILWMQHNL